MIKKFMKEIKILRILNRLNLGGPTYNAVFLSKYISSNFKTLILAGKKLKSEESSKFIADKYKVKIKILKNMSRSINFFNDLLSIYEVFKIIRKYKPDIVHTHASKSGFIGRFVCIFFPKIIVFHTYHGHTFHSYFNKYISNLFILIEKLLALRTDKIITISKSQKNEICKKFKIAKLKKFEVVNLGINLEEFSRNSDIQRKRFKKKYKINNKKVVGIIGRLTKIKNHKFFIDVVRKILNNRNDVVFFIIGDGENKKELISYAHKKNLIVNSSKKIKKTYDICFTSWVKNLDDIYPGIDIVCNTSLNEGTPLSLIEAMAYRKPILATNVGGVKDLIINGYNGYCTNIENKKKFVNLLKDLLSKKSKCNKLGSNGYNFVNKKFAHNTLVSKMEKLYLNEISKKNKNR